LCKSGQPIRQKDLPLASGLFATGRHRQVIGADVVVANIVAVIDGRERKCAEILKMDKPYRLWTQLRSPIDGVVLRRYLRPNEVISTQPPTPILEVGDASRHPR